MSHWETAAMSQVTRLKRATWAFWASGKHDRLQLPWDDLGLPLRISKCHYYQDTLVYVIHHILYNIISLLSDANRTLSTF